jgi:hypothetical protein
LDGDVDGAALLDQVGAALARYVILPSPEALVAVVLWIAATHASPAWNCAPRLVIRAPEKRCGKSRLLDLVEALSHRPLATTNASPSAVYRSIGMAPDDPPTLLIDEADAIFGPKAGDNEDLRGLLNAGHQRGRPTMRYDAGTRTVERIETFALAALAGIGTMPDTIEDRAVVVRMRRRAPGEVVAPYRVRRDRPALADLKTRLNQWVRANLDALTVAEPVMPLEDRAADTWEPLIALADYAGGDWPHLARSAALALLADREEAAEVPLKVRLLMDCRAAFAGAPALPSIALLNRLRADEEAPWADLAGTGLTVRRLAAILREYDVCPANRRWEDGTQSKGYARYDFTDAWSRYCPAEDEAQTPLESPSQPSQALPRRSARDGLTPWDGSNAQTSVPALTSVPGLTCNGTAGTVGTDISAHPHPAVCITCRQTLTYDDGTHTHPGCEATA